jgi:hypothetical protein
MFGCSGGSQATLPPGGGSNSFAGDSSVNSGGSSTATTGGSSAASGGAQVTGGVANTGGIAATGGKAATGGSSALGGSTSAAGGAKSGGASATGGMQPSGGSNAAGGSLSTGGTKATTGGSVSTGGSKSAGGSAPTGGNGTTGGNAPIAGSSSTAGGAASFKCNNLSLAPSTTGVAKPSGTAGGMKVIDWAGFKGAVSYTFDDNTASQMANYSALKATGAHFTWFVVGSWNPSAQYKTTLADGQEIANHTYSHSGTGNLSDLQQNETYLTTNFGVTAASMAAPNCDQSWSSIAPSVLFQNRGPCGGGAATVAPRDSTSAFLLPAYLPATGEASSTMDAAVASGKWRIYVIHGFDSQGGTYQPVPIGNVTTSMSNSVKNGYWTETMTNVGAYWQGQKAISASATTSATWTLPAHFPPNMCVRITTTGGTVTQKGQTIPWNDHGYYEISLDAGAVTIQ